MKIAVSLHRSGFAFTASTIFLREAFEQVQFRGSRMAVDQSAGLDEGNRRQCVRLDVAVEIRSVLNVRGADSGIGHDGGVVLEWIANVAVLVRVRADGAVVELIGVRHIVVPLIAVILP